eukprot:3751518-Prymnesium_polylepis.1
MLRCMRTFRIRANRPHRSCRLNRDVKAQMCGDTQTGTSVGVVSRRYRGGVTQRRTGRNYVT